MAAVENFTFSFLVIMKKNSKQKWPFYGFAHEKVHICCKNYCNIGRDWHIPKSKIAAKQNLCLCSSETLRHENGNKPISWMLYPSRITNFKFCLAFSQCSLQ